MDRSGVMTGFPLHFSATFFKNATLGKSGNATFSENVAANVAPNVAVFSQ